MKEALYHALGVCGEHTHPHLLNVGLFIVACAIVYKLFNPNKSTQ